MAPKKQAGASHRRTASQDTTPAVPLIHRTPEPVTMPPPSSGPTRRFPGTGLHPPPLVGAGVGGHYLNKEEEDDVLSPRRAMRALLLLDGVYLRKLAAACDYQLLVDHLHSLMNGVSYHRVLFPAQPLREDFVASLAAHAPDGPGIEVNAESCKHGTDPGDPVKPSDRAGVDAGIATAMLTHAWLDQCDRVVVVAGDGYFVEAMRTCRDLLGKYVTVAGTVGTLAYRLQLAANEVVFLDGVLETAGDAAQYVRLQRHLRYLRQRPHTVQFGLDAMAAAGLDGGGAAAPPPEQSLSRPSSDRTSPAATITTTVVDEAEAIRLQQHTEEELARAALMQALVLVDPRPDEDVPAVGLSPSRGGEDELVGERDQRIAKRRSFLTKASKKTSSPSSMAAIRAGAT